MINDPNTNLTIQLLQNGIRLQNDTLKCLKAIHNANPNRSLSLAITKQEESIMWLQKMVDEYSPKSCGNCGYIKET